MNEYVTKITLYDSMYLSEFINTPFNLYGGNCNSFSQWIPIKYEDSKNYDIILERSILCSDRFVIIKLGKDMRGDLI